MVRKLVSRGGALRHENSGSVNKLCHEMNANIPAELFAINRTQ